MSLLALVPESISFHFYFFNLVSESFQSEVVCFSFFFFLNMISFNLFFINLSINFRFCYYNMEVRSNV